MADALVVILFVGVIAYGVLGGADFGSGFWDLTAGSSARGARPRALVELAVGPVWETNHTWLIFDLVILWTCFPMAFASIMSTLFIPLTLAVFGIVLRGSSFAFRKVSAKLRYRRLFGIFFATSSIVTPFFFGTVIGAIASGRVPVGNEAGSESSSWVSPTSFAVGLLAVALCAFSSAILLCRDAQRMGDAELTSWFRRRSITSGVACGLLSLVVLIALVLDGHSFLSEALTGKALALAGLSGCAAVTAMVLVARDRPAAARYFGAAAVAVVLAGWGVAQYPYLLPTSLTIEQGAAPSGTLSAVFAIVVVALSIIVPSLVLLLRLDDHNKLEIETLDEVAAANMA